MPAILELHLATEVPPPFHPARLHGAASALLGHAPPGGRPRFSTRPPAASDGGVSWRLGWLVDDPCRRDITSVAFGDTEHRTAGMTLREWTFAECATARGTRRAALDVVSPLYFSRGGRDHPAPDAVLIARSLLDRWDDHAPPGLAAPAAARRHLLDTVYLVEFAGRTQRIPVGTATRQTGFVGSMTLALTRAADDTTAALFAALLRFAEVAGVGAQTGYGFGAVTVRIPDRPHGPRRVARRVATVGNV